MLEAVQPNVPKVESQLKSAMATFMASRDPFLHNMCKNEKQNQNTLIITEAIMWSQLLQEIKRMLEV